jgi:Asp-tRNA(Asn)/Glu-tRNA(Gln) amidotransferase A subunit family amidase
VHNLWALDRISGGSSAGSAVAIAAGLCAASIGTDTGGSIRVPSAFCGTVGLKPSFGRVSIFGTMPLSPSLDHVGPLARSVADAAILLGVIAGSDSLDPSSSPRPVEDFRGALREKSLRKFRMGRPREHYWERLDPEVRRAAEAAVRDMEKRGAVVRDSIDQTLELVKQGQTTQAYAQAKTGYLDHFEYVEIPLRVVAPALTAQAETKFAEIRGLITSKAPVTEVRPLPRPIGRSTVIDASARKFGG